MRKITDEKGKEERKYQVEIQGLKNANLLMKNDVMEIHKQLEKSEGKMVEMEKEWRDKERRWIEEKSKIEKMVEVK